MTCLLLLLLKCTDPVKSQDPVGFFTNVKRGIGAASVIFSELFNSLDTTACGVNEPGSTAAFHSIKLS
jgi:hypothetical protein